jgi:hypothetical protein
VGFDDVVDHLAEAEAEVACGGDPAFAVFERGEVDVDAALVERERAVQRYSTPSRVG